MSTNFFSLHHKVLQNLTLSMGVLIFYYDSMNNNKVLEMQITVDAGYESRKRRATSLSGYWCHLFSQQKYVQNNSIFSKILLWYCLLKVIKGFGHLAICGLFNAEENPRLVRPVKSEQNCKICTLYLGKHFLQILPSVWLFLDFEN